VLHELLQRDCRVHAVVHSSDVGISDQRITTFRGDLDDVRVLESAVTGTTAAIHLVGIISENPSRNVTFHRMHVDFTRHVVDACIRHGVQRYVHMSALGARADSPSLYHQTKAAAEAIVEASPLAWTIIRPSLIHGPGGELTEMLEGWARGSKAPWVGMPYFGAGLLGGGPKFLLQPIHVEDVARIFAEALDRPQTIGKRYDLGGAQRLSWPEMHRIFSRALLGREKRTLAIPAWYATVLTHIAPRSLLPFNRAQVLMSQEHSIADLEPIQNDFGFLPESFADSLKRYVGS
jgi:uncharacterized protein YbjT (DUF2867 family)